MREKFTQPILYWFTQRWVTSISQNKHWVPLVITHILQFIEPQRGDLETTRTTHPLCKHTPLARTTSNFKGFPHTYKFMKEQIQESWKEHITPEFTGIRKLPWSDLEPVHNYSTIFQTFEKILSKPISISLYLKTSCLLF